MAYKGYCRVFSFPARCLLAFQRQGRITESEKLNSHQADLETKIFELEKEVKKASEAINDKNKNIEKKTNYLEMKTVAVNNTIIEKKQIAVNDVVEFKAFETKETKKDRNKIKKNFFWSSSDE